MRLLFVELKRIIKTKSVRLLIILSILLTILLTYLPISYVKYTYQKDGNDITVSGIAAINYRKNAQEEFSGEVTPEKMAKALEKYKEYLAIYGEDGIYTGKLPASEYYTEILPIYKYIIRLREVYADPQTGMAINILDLDTRDAYNFDMQCQKRFKEVVENEQSEHLSAQVQAKKLYDKVSFPLEYYYGIDGSVMDYLSILIFVLVIICLIIAAPVFSTEYQTSSDQILRCTKYGKRPLAIAKITSCILVVSGIFSVCISVFVMGTTLAFGKQGAESSMQIIYSAISFLPLTIGGLQKLLICAGFLFLVNTVLCTLFCSSRAKTVFASVVISLIVAILPIVIGMIVGGNIGNWIRCLLPSGGVGLSNSFLYSVIDTEFVYMGEYSLWMPFAMLGCCIIEIPIFTVLIVFNYCKHIVK